jgi:hypothetical protein
MRWYGPKPFVQLRVEVEHAGRDLLDRLDDLRGAVERPERLGVDFQKLHQQEPRAHGGWGRRGQGWRRLRAAEVPVVERLVRDIKPESALNQYGLSDGSVIQGARIAQVAFEVLHGEGPPKLG